MSQSRKPQKSPSHKRQHKFQISADALKQSVQFQGVPALSGGQIGGRNISNYYLMQ